MLFRSIARSAQRSAVRYGAAKVEGEVMLPGGLKAHCARGGMSSATYRERYYMHLKMTTDPFLQDFFFKRFVFQSCDDPNQYTLWILCSIAFGLSVGSCWRHLLFNPDVYFRRQENLKPMPDRHRQYTYALPFYNHQLRNSVAQYRWCFIDNEPDYMDEHALGIRPNRRQAMSNCQPWQLWPGIPQYSFSDDMMTSCSHKNMKAIYVKAGYCKEEVVEE
jgi:hypothetical protein